MWNWRSDCWGPNGRCRQHTKQDPWAVKELRVFGGEVRPSEAATIDFTKLLPQVNSTALSCSIS